MTEVTPIERGKAEAVSSLLEERSAELVGRKGKATITVPKFEDWGDGALGALMAGNFREWADEALSAEDFKAWKACSPTIKHVAEFLAALKAKTGEDLGESPAS